MVECRQLFHNPHGRPKSASQTLQQHLGLLVTHAKFLRNKAPTQYGIQDNPQKNLSGRDLGAAEFRLRYEAGSSIRRQTRSEARLALVLTSDHPGAEEVIERGAEFAEEVRDRVSPLAKNLRRR